VSKILVDAIEGRPTPHRPVWIMRQAGRYLPEYRKLKETYTFEEMSRNPEMAADVTMMPMRRFDLDAAIVFADLMSPISSLGVDFKFDPGPVVGSPVRTRADVDSLRTPDPNEIAPEVIDTLRLVRSELSDDKTLLGFVGAPWSLAAYLVQGHGKSDFPELRAMALREPELLSDLLGRLVELVSTYACAQWDAGADAIQVFDTWAGLIPATQWEWQVRPHLVRLLQNMGDHGIRRIVFVQNAPHLADRFGQLPSEVLAVDWREDLPAVASRLPRGKAFQGNIDPANLYAGPDATVAATKDLLEKVPRQRHIVNLGHGIMPATSLDSVAALIDVVHSEGQV
jgi:uroporphyrinogen decarboxylase